MKPNDTPEDAGVPMRVGQVAVSAPNPVEAPIQPPFPTQAPPAQIPPTQASPTQAPASQTFQPNSDVQTTKLPLANSAVPALLIGLLIVVLLLAVVAYAFFR